SDRSARGYDRETLTKSLLACADALGFDRFGVVGQSFGGFWSLSLAFAAPERISRMVLVNSAGGPMTEEEIEERRARMAAQPAQTDEDRETVVENTIRTIFKDPSRVPASYRGDLHWQMRVADPAMAGRFGTLFEGMARERFDQIQIPTLVVFGEADAMIPIERGRRLAAAIPSARFV